MGRVGIELEEAVQIILENGKEMDRTETVTIQEANSRILAEDIVSPIDNPPFDRSPLDGFALRSEDLAGATQTDPKQFVVVDTVYAGGVSKRKLQPKEAIRIMTGAPIPEGADCVIRIEDVKEEAGQATILVGQELKPFENYCFQGEDVKKGTLILRAGEKLTYVEQGILASLGIDKVKVYEKLKAALFITGDEVVAPGMELRPGKIYDSNCMLLHSRLLELGVTPVVAKYLPDDPSIVANTIDATMKDVDFIVTTGGVSVGDKDIFHEVLPLIGAERLFWRVKLKPGTPAMFAIYKGKPMFHLSGNPFAAATTFELLVRPYIAKVCKDDRLAMLKGKAILKNAFLKASNGRRFLRANVQNGYVELPPVEKHSSGILSSMKGCNCFIDIPAGSSELAPGMEVDILLL